jgi:hypothetical protein
VTYFCNTPWRERSEVIRNNAVDVSPQLERRNDGGESLLYTDKRNFNQNEEMRGKPYVRTQHVQREFWGPIRLVGPTFTVFTTYPPHSTGPRVRTIALGSREQVGRATHTRQKGCRYATDLPYHRADDMPSPSHLISASVESDGDTFENYIPKIMDDSAGESESAVSIGSLTTNGAEVSLGTCLRRWLRLLMRGTNENLSACTRSRSSSSMVTIHTHPL